MRKLWFLVFLVAVVGGGVAVLGERVRLVSEVTGYELFVTDRSKLDSFLREIGYWNDGVREMISRPRIVRPWRLAVVLSNRVENDYRIFQKVGSPPFQAFGFRYQRRSLTNQARLYYAPAVLRELTDDDNRPYIWQRTTFDVLKMICFQTKYNDRYDDDTRCNQIAGRYAKESQFIRLVRKKGRAWKLVRPAFAATCWGTYECGSWVYTCSIPGTCSRAGESCGLYSKGTCTRDCDGDGGTLPCGWTNQSSCLAHHCSGSQCQAGGCNWGDPPPPPATPTPVCTPDCGTRVCGGAPNGCGSCGSCSADRMCYDGSCVQCGHNEWSGCENGTKYCRTQYSDAINGSCDTFSNACSNGATTTDGCREDTYCRNSSAPSYAYHGQTVTYVAIRP